MLTINNEMYVYIHVSIKTSTVTGFNCRPVLIVFRRVKVMLLILLLLSRSINSLMLDWQTGSKYK